MSLKKDKVLMKILKHIEAQHCGSGEVELEDAVDPCAFLTQHYKDDHQALTTKLRIVEAQLEALDPTWSKGEVATSMFDAPADGEETVLKLSIYQLGFTEQTSIKGKSKSVHILDTVENFLDNPYSSNRSPLDVKPPLGTVASTIAPYSVVHSIGFSKSLACKLIVLAVEELMRTGKMGVEEVSSVQRFLQPLFYVKAIWKGTSGAADDMYDCISGKTMESQRPRPDVVQVAHAFSMRARVEGVPYETYIDTWLTEYNTRATNTKQLSDLEIKIIKILPLQTDALQQKIAYHWQNFKIDESGLPYVQLSTDPFLNGTRPRDSANALWSEIQAASPEKRQFSVQRKIGVFLKSLNDAKRLRKKVHLKIQSGTFRDAYSAEVSWEMACLFCHFAPQFQRALTPTQWAEVLKRFFRGQFDAELSEKVSHKDPNLTVASFRFLQLYGFKPTAATPSSQVASRDEAVAVKEHEQSDVNLAKRKLATEVATWVSYKDAVTTWQCKGELQQRAQLMETEAENKNLISKECDERLPTRDVLCPEHLATFFAGCSQSWAESRCVKLEDVLQVYWVDLTIPGFNYNRTVLRALTLLSAALTASPDVAVGIILAPNCGPYGMEYTDAGVRKSVREVATLLDDSDLNLCYREITLAFDPSTIPKRSHRQGKATGWLVVSALLSASGELRSMFATCGLWVRGIVVDVPMANSKQWVNPLSAVAGSVNPGSDFSTGQGRKQWLTGWKLVKMVLESVFQNLSLTPDRCASVYVVYGYDNSVAEAALRMSSVLSLQVVTVCWADMDSDTQTSDHLERIAKFVIRGNKAVMKTLLEENLFFLTGWKKPVPVAPETPRPTYKESDYKIICPVASGHLPLRAEWLDLYNQKYTQEDSKEQFKAIVDEHNKLHNPDGKPHASADRKRTASAAGLPGGPQDTGVEIPEDPSAPKTVADLTAKDGPVSMITIRGQQFHFTKSGHLWINGVSDDVLPRGLCIALVFGKFHVNEHVQAEKNKPGAVCIDWHMTSESHEGTFSCQKEGMNEKFPEDVTATLGEFLSYLAKNGVVEPHIECHTHKTEFLKDDKDEVTGCSVTISNTEPCTLKVMNRSTNHGPEFDNLGSSLVLGDDAKSWDLTTRKHAKGYLSIKDRMTYDESPNIGGLAPLKFGVCLEKTIRVKKDTLRQLA